MTLFLPGIGGRRGLRSGGNLGAEVTWDLMKPTGNGSLYAKPSPIGTRR